jgi:hypothetical protein
VQTEIDAGLNHLRTHEVTALPIAHLLVAIEGGPEGIIHVLVGAPNDITDAALVEIRWSGEPEMFRALKLDGLVDRLNQLPDTNMEAIVYDLERRLARFITRW